MTTCSSSLRAICLGLALLAAKASADRRPQPPQPQALATLESLPMFSGSLSHPGARDGDNEYDRGQEYMLAMPQGTQPSPPPATFETDSDTADTSEGEDADRGSFGSSSTTSDDNGALYFEGASSEIDGTVHSGGALADVREYLHHGLPVVAKPYETEQPSELSHTYNVDPQAFLRKFLERQQPIVSQMSYKMDSDSAFRKYFEQEKPIVSQTYEVDSDSAFRKYFEQEKPIVSQTYEDSDSAFRKYFEQQKPLVSQTYEDSDSAFRKYFEQQKPIVSQIYEEDSDSASMKYFEQQKPIVSLAYDLDSDSVLRKYNSHQQKPLFTKKTEILPNPVARNSYSLRPVYNVLPAPVVRKSVTILPPPIVQKLFKVMPAPVIRRYFTAPPVVQSVKASPPVFNKFVKNIFVQQPAQRQQPFVVVPPPTKNVYNLIKLAAPTPKPTTPEPTTPEPTAAVPTTPVPTTPVPTTPMPTTPVPTTAVPTTTPPALEAEALVAQKDEAEEEATEEQKLKSIGKMVVVETVRRVVDVPEFDGPAPPPAHSEETVVDPDGTVRKFEKYIEYDQVSGSQQAAGVRASHSKKQSSKSSYAAQVSPVLVDAAKTASAASPATARLLHSSAMEGNPAFFSHLSGSSFEPMTRTQFAKIQPINAEETAESASFMPEENLSEQMEDRRPQNIEPQEKPTEYLELPSQRLLQKPSEYLELPTETVAHLTTEAPALPKEAATVPPFA